MTFTVMARCPRTGQSGIAVTTVSIAVGGLCPFFTAAGDIVTSQAYASLRDGLLVAEALGNGAEPQDALEAAARDPDLAYRQIAILARDGGTRAHTGDRCRPWAGHIAEHGLVVCGNVLAGPHVIEAMRDAVRDAEGEPLDERLLGALEAGRGAGGQATPDGRPLAERSASIRVVGAGEEAGLPVLDLRVDLHPSAIHELRRLHAIHAVYLRYSELRDRDPARSPSILDYEAEEIRRGGPFAERPSCFR